MTPRTCSVTGGCTSGHFRVLVTSVCTVHRAVTLLVDVHAVDTSGLTTKRGRRAVLSAGKRNAQCAYILLNNIKC